VWSSVDGAEWRLEVRQAPWEGRHCAGCVVHGDKMWVVGGDINQGHYQHDVWCSSDGIDWTCTCENAPWGQPHPRTLHITMAFEDAIWVLGGQTMPEMWSDYHSHSFKLPKDSQIFHADAWRSRDGKHWECVADNLPWAPRGMIGGSAVLNGRMWLLGGGTYATPQAPEELLLNDVWSSANGIEWTRHTAEAPWSARRYHDVCVWDEKLWVLEGCNEEPWIDDRTGKFAVITEVREVFEGDPGVGDLQQNRKDVWWSADGLEWHEVKGTPWAPRHAASVFVHNDAVWMVAGNNLTADVWKMTRSRSVAAAL
jgi:hypothetical protein